MSIFEKEEAIPPDPIFGLAARFLKDKHPNKIDLTVGIYREKDLKTRTLRCVKMSEKVLWKIEEDKTYLPMGGDQEFIKESLKLLYGEDYFSRFGGKLFGAQTLGATGAIRIAAEIVSKNLSKIAYVSTPTWPNHHGILEQGGLEVRNYPYYNFETHTLDFEKMMNCLSEAEEKSLVVLHTCCHNPTGSDPMQSQWKELSSLLLKKKLIPLFDCAYQGFGKGIEEDAWPIRYFAEQGHEMFVANSYSKNFGLYGERIGTLSILSQNEQISQNMGSIVRYRARVGYSNPPRHGAGIVTTILQDVGLREMWKGEVEQMKTRIEEMRGELYRALTHQFGKENYSFLKRQMGMFSMLKIPPEQVDRMISEYGVYLTHTGRINLTGLSEKNIPHFMEALIKTSS